ncbi:PRC-barrel domain protein [Jannaschia seosinensis]|uniref:PRC-barrel domain protein n=1 Tax=Jannaschia seosinensis TaxID=313367 RepID=A0A0M7BC74_9RHOB|nr:PRC-barrel domain-containing protein [Jannaschia seosinensis]CUH39668.1 PRC-barrel domain protein [Jannaschia seosinensis]
MTHGSNELVAAADVTGEAVFGADDTRVGTIDRVMIDKVSGKVAYAVMSFGGVLGIGGDERPVPWDTLTYDTSLGGFRTSITEAQLNEAPRAESGWEQDRDFHDRTHTAYGTAPNFYV